MHNIVILLASGSGTRMMKDMQGYTQKTTQKNIQKSTKNSTKKQYLDIGGKSILEISLYTALKFGADLIVVTTPNEQEDKEITAQIIEKVKSSFAMELSAQKSAVSDGITLNQVMPVILTTTGGQERFYSVIKAIEHLGDFLNKYDIFKDKLFLPNLNCPESDTVIFVHDAVRPYASVELYQQLYNKLVDSSLSGVIPVLPMVDTVKLIDSNGIVEKTIDRSVVARVQTPQAFIYRDIKQAYSRLIADIDEGMKLEELRGITDDASVLERYGFRIGTITGETANIKITYPTDLTKI